VLKTLKNRHGLLLSLLMLLVLQISGCALPPLSKVTQPPTSEQVIATENAYQQLVKKVGSTDWNKAVPKDWDDVGHSINSLLSYRDTPMIARYMSYLKYIKANEISQAIGVANNIPAEYTGDLQEEIRKVRSEGKALAKAQDLKYYAELIRQGDFKTLRSETVEKVSLDADYNAIYNYLSALEFQNTGIRTAMIVSLSHISMPYHGLMSEEITKMVDQNAAEIQYMRDLLSGKSSEGKPKPYIGMTTNEVSASSWGPPDTQMRALTTAGKEDQWEYAPNKVIFIENGFVTAIQY